MSESQRDTRQQRIAADDATGDLSAIRGATLPAEDLPEETDTSSAAAEAAALERGSAMLVVKRGPNVGSRFVLNQPVMTAGRHPDSDIFLDDITVSRRHAEFRTEDDEFHLVDLGSLNGTYRNREPVDSAVLADGDVLQIGNFRLIFRTAQTP